MKPTSPLFGFVLLFALNLFPLYLLCAAQPVKNDSDVVVMDKLVVSAAKYKWYYATPVRLKPIEFQLDRNINGVNPCIIFHNQFM